LKFDELMKRETGYCLSAHFLLIGYSSTLHQRMKGNERKDSGTERKANFPFPSPKFSSHCPINSDEILMKG